MKKAIDFSPACAGWKPQGNALVIMAVAVLFAVSGCKPTEKNYRSAYEAAIKKKTEQTRVDADLIPEGGLLDDEGPRKVGQGSDGYLLKTERLALSGHDREALLKAGVPDSLALLRPYCVAVASFRMSTNAAALAADMRARGYDAFTATSPDEKVYTIIYTADSIADAGRACVSFSGDNPGYVYVGLDGATVLHVTNL